MDKEQEPIGWWDEKLGFFSEKHFDQLQPLYTAPPKRQPLDDDEIRDCAESENLFYFENKEEFDAFARAIEAAHGIGVEE